MQKTKSKTTTFGQRLNPGWLLVVFGLFFVSASSVQAASYYFHGTAYGTFDQARTAALKDCTTYAITNTCATTEPSPVYGAYGDVLDFYCKAKAVGASCAPANTQTSRCIPLPSHPAGALNAGCYNTPAACQPKDSAYYSPPSGLTTAYYDSVAVNGPVVDGSTLSCTAGKPCLDEDKDLRPFCSGSFASPPKTDPGFSYGNVKDDCDDKDIWSHYYGSANIEKIEVNFNPTYSAQTKANKMYTPTTPYSLLDTIQIKVTFKKKCGLATPTPPSVPMNIYLVLPDARELPLGANPINLARTSDFIYTVTIDLQNQLTEDLIATIAKAATKGAGGKESATFKLKVLGAPYGDIPATVLKAEVPKFADIPLTNCAQVYGGGKYKIVYMRGQSSGFNTQSLLAQADKDVSGFNTIEPLKSNNSQLSHFVDLKNHNDDWPIVTDVLPSLCKHANFSTTQFFQDDRPDTPQTISSCGRFASYYYFHQAKLLGAYSDGGNLPGTLYVSVLPPEGESPEGQYLTPEVAVHEFAHAFGHLTDEYFICDPKDLARDPYPTDYHDNCSIDPLTDWARGLKLSQFGVYAQAYPGCSFQQSYSGRYTYRPSSNSIMNYNYSGTPFYNMFNAVSCGWLLKKFKGGLARDYFNTCAFMPGIIPVGK